MLQSLKRKLRKWQQFPRWERVVLLGLCWRLPLLWVQLRLLSFGSVLRLADKRAAGRIVMTTESGIPSGWQPLAFAKRCEQLTTIAACNGLYRATCLPQALALYDLLGRYGLQARLRIGVLPGSQPLQAHAWVEYATEVLGEPVHQYLPVSGLLEPAAFRAGARSILK